MKWSVWVPAFLLVLLGLACACSAGTVVEPDRADASGVVLEVLEAPVMPQTVTRILVEHPGRPSDTRLSIVHIGLDTQIWLRTAKGQLQAGGVDEIHAGTWAEIEITNLELRSLPRQVFATRIELRP